eukprot:832825-Amphidinium_carterae.1
MKPPTHDIKSRLPKAFPLTASPELASLRACMAHPEGFDSHRARFQLRLKACNATNPMTP